jgi:hypothetical protein
MPISYIVHGVLNFDGEPLYVIVIASHSYRLRNIGIVIVSDSYRFIHLDAIIALGNTGNVIASNKYTLKI